jgi:hypothetical protein
MSWKFVVSTSSTGAHDITGLRRCWQTGRGSTNHRRTLLLGSHNDEVDEELTR